MRRIALIATFAALLATAATGSGASNFPETIALPNGWLPEGIAIAPGGTFYAGSRANGAVYGGSLRTGDGAIVVPGQAGRVAVGVDYDRGRLFVAGGGTGDAFVYDAETGAEIAAYDFAGPPTNTFVNDVIVTRTAAWFTESRSAVLYKVPLGPDGTPGLTFETVPLTSPSPAMPPANSNGIDATPNGQTLIIVQSDPGKLFTVDPETGVADEIELTGMTPGNTPPDVSVTRPQMVPVGTWALAIAAERVDRQEPGTPSLAFATSFARARGRLPTQSPSTLAHFVPTHRNTA